MLMTYFFKLIVFLINVLFSQVHFKNKTLKSALFLDGDSSLVLKILQINHLRCEYLEMNEYLEHCDR